jgi:hypothetical protein
MGANSGLSLTSLAIFTTTPVNATIATTAITVSNVAPIASLQNNVSDNVSGSYPLSVINVQLTTAGICAFDIRLVPAGATGLSNPKMQDAKSKFFGYIVYFSEPLTFSGKRAQNPFSSVCGFTGVWPNTTLGAGPVAGFRVSMSCNAQLANWKRAPALGNIYQATVVGVGSDGTQVVIGKSYLTVAATLTAAPTT